MYSYCKINSVADLVITFTVTGDFALTPVAEPLYSTFHAAKCRTFQNLSSLGPLFGSSSSLSLFLIFFSLLFVWFFFFFSWSQHPSFYHCIFFFFFWLGLLLYLLTIIMYISQSGSGTARRGAGGRTQPAAPPGVPLYLCVRDACDI